MIDISFTPGSVITARNRLWRVDGQPEADVIVASTIDGGDTQQMTLYVPFERIAPGKLAPPSQEHVGTIQAQDLLLRAYRVPGVERLRPGTDLGPLNRAAPSQTRAEFAGGPPLFAAQPS